MDYTGKLKKSAEKSGSIVCMGLDPVLQYLPGDSTDIKEKITSFFESVFTLMVQRNVMPGAFKPNLGFYSCLDRPREGKFAGSNALAKVLNMLDGYFSGIPVILDYKRGDIARSSQNYALEGFDAWKCDSVTVSPYMGSDSVEPFLKEAVSWNGGVYVLDRTSNPGGREFQNIRMADGKKKLFTLVGEKILFWAEKYPGTGAVVGAVSTDELRDLAMQFKGKNIPLLIPGVGSQGGSMSEVTGIIKETGYEASLIRVNISSAVTHPWAKKKEAVPKNWAQVCVDSFLLFNEEVVL